MTILCILAVVWAATTTPALRTKGHALLLATLHGLSYGVGYCYVGVLLAPLLVLHHVDKN
jgi:hypothetical protein